jgi:hypothetical protein
MVRFLCQRQIQVRVLEIHDELDDRIIVLGRKFMPRMCLENIKDDQVKDLEDLSWT